VKELMGKGSSAQSQLAGASLGHHLPHGDEQGS